ncbi:MAG: DUF5331 domain-containing protein [Nostocaceae cyanobacterium]|nr:DUF5331 domain-containing protein [Nostocaceae cyanobacterium]
MACFYSFTDSLKSKWLEFFQTNREWIELHMNVESVYTPDGGKRPSSYLVLGVVNALEPKLSQLMLPFSRLNADADTLVDVLGLNFDPNIALGNKFVPPAATEEIPENAEETTTEVVVQSSDEQVVVVDTQTNEFAEVATPDLQVAPDLQVTSDFNMEDNHEETLMVSEETIQNELSQISGDDSTISGEFQQDSGVEVNDDAFGDISFDEELKDVSQAAPEGEIGESMLDEFKVAEDNGFDSVLKDVWSEETASHQNPEGDNQLFSGEGESKNPFDDTEMAELFPNN